MDASVNESSLLAYANEDISPLCLSLSLLFASSLSLSYSLLMSLDFISLCRAVDKKEKEGEEEGDEHFASHTYLYIHLSSTSFSAVLDGCCLIFPRRSSSSIFFLVVCARDIEFRKNIKKSETERNSEGGETTHFFPYVCLSSSRISEW